MLHNPRRAPAAAALVLTLLAVPAVQAQTWVSLANPNWNILLTDFGYSDFLFDNTPGYEGREYLSGEWGAAVGYQKADGASVGPMWLEPQFLFPDWATNSTFRVVSPITVTGANADGLPIAESVLTNDEVEVRLRFEMVDTVTGVAMGATPASETGAGSSVTSNRYILSQTATVRNVSGGTLTGLRFYQFLHGLNATSGVFDNRPHGGALPAFNQDISLVGQVLYATGASGATPQGVEDRLTFQSSLVPSGFEIGTYGTEGNGYDDHWSAKPLDGVHKSIEADWNAAPYASRLNRDQFAPANPWVGGGARYELGTLAPNATASIEIHLALRTASRVVSNPADGTPPSGSGGCNGGSGVPGGIDYDFDDPNADGSCFGTYDDCDAHELEVRIASGEFDHPSFLRPSDTLQVWTVEFHGTATGGLALTFGFDPAPLPPSLDLSGLKIFHFHGGAWTPLPTTVNLLTHTVSVNAPSTGAFALGLASNVLHTVAADVLPLGAGTITGTGDIPEGGVALLVATANPGYAFQSWSDAGGSLGTSPTYSFTVGAPRSLTANFIEVVEGVAINTLSKPVTGGTTTGGGGYTAGTLATVTATPAPGHKFSKWIDETGAILSTAASYTFTVGEPLTLTAKFKPVYTILTSVEPAGSGEISADTQFEVGDPVELKAQAQKDWSFSHWSQNGVTVSTEANFTFNTTGDRTLVAHFEQGVRIDAAADPVNAGNVAGGGIVPADTSVNLSAEAKEGYVFLEWTENGTRFSTDETISLTADKVRTFTARFSAKPKCKVEKDTPSTLKVKWPANTTGWILEECDDLATGNWVPSTATPVLVGPDNEVTAPQPTPGSSKFYRIRYL